MAPPDPDAIFKCRRLDCALRRRVCVARQVVAELEVEGTRTTRCCQRRAAEDRSEDTRRKRGIGLTFPTCYRCPQGQRIREELGDEVAGSVRRGSRGIAAFLAWAAYMRERTRLGEAPTIDSHLADEH